MRKLARTIGRKLGPINKPLPEGEVMAMEDGILEN